MKTTFFSFVIPCYKAASVLSKTIGSILDQDYKDFEIICVLDGPDEDARMVLDAFSEVKVLEIEHGGAPKARNAGLEMASGDYVLFSDADFVWNPGILRVFNEKIAETGADFVYGGYKWTDAPGGHSPPDFDEYLLSVSNICDGSNPVRTDLVRKIGGWDEKIERFQDWDLWLRVIEAGGE